MIQWGEDMNEATGLGGYYERCCRAGIVAAARYLAEHPHADTGAVTDAIMTGFVTADDGQKHSLSRELTPTQHAIVMWHVRFIADHGWPAYCIQMSAPMKVYDDE